MTTDIYLTQKEQEVFATFEAEVRTGWTTHLEDLDCYESPRQLQMRAFMSDFTAHPELEILAKQLIDSPESVKINEFEALSPDLQQELYFIMGASGVRMIIETLLTEDQNDETMYALSVLTTIRHKLLTLNSK